MDEKLYELIKKIQLEKRIISYDEAATKQAIILQILSVLGWDTFNVDEIWPEYSVSEKKVDYALRHNNSNKVFIEVKKVGEDLEKHQEQLLSYSFQEGIRLAILTNGISWWFYLPLHEGSWEQRKFYTIEIYDQDAQEIVQKFISFLSKQNVISGAAIENAENIFKGKQKQNLIKETLPKAWDKILEGPDEDLVELLAVTTEKLCGYKPEYTTVEEFITTNLQKIKAFSSPSQNFNKSKTIITTAKTRITEQSYINKTIMSFVFNGTKYEVRTWKDFLLKICSIMLNTHRNQFDQVLNLIGRKRPYFTRNLHELRAPEKIIGSDIFVETNLSANSIVKLSYDILLIFGYNKNDITIEAR